MPHLRPEVDEAEAARRIRGQHRGLLARVWRRLAPAPALQKAERVWIPAYLVCIALDHRGERSRVTCSVDGLSGAFAIFDARETVLDGEPEGETFEPVLDVAVAERIARESLVTAILRRRGRAGKPVPQETESVVLLRWPYWVFYHRRRFGAMDIYVVDAVTGDRAGLKIKLGLLDAFRAAARERAAKEGE